MYLKEQVQLRGAPTASWAQLTQILDPCSDPGSLGHPDSLPPMQRAALALCSSSPAEHPGSSGIRGNQIASESMSLGLTFLNSSANQYQAQTVDSMHVGQGYNLLKGTSQDVLEIPPYISQSALLGGKCDSVRLGGFGVRLEPGAGKSVGLKKQQAVWTNPLQPSLWASVSLPIPHTSSLRFHIRGTVRGAIV